MPYFPKVIWGVMRSRNRLVEYLCELDFPRAMSKTSGRTNVVSLSVGRPNVTFEQ